jgi:lipoate-protein ligase A
MRAFRVETPPMDLTSHMALDEALLDGARPRELRLRFFLWPEGGVHGASFGCCQRVREAEEASRRRYPGRGIPLVRRLTGGGVVFHDGDVTFSLIFPWPRGQAPAQIYGEIHGAARAGLASRGVHARLWEGPSRGGAECFRAPTAWDLVGEDGGKFLGGALRRRAGMGLYQGSLRPEGLGAGAGRLMRAVEDGIGLFWRVLFEPCGPGREAAELAGRLARERYGSRDWNDRR